MKRLFSIFSIIILLVLFAANIYAAGRWQLVGVPIVFKADVGTMSGNETFDNDDALIFVKDPGGTNRTFNPTGTFIKGILVYLVNTADAAENITFDSEGIAKVVGQNECGIFTHDGSAWRTVWLGQNDLTQDSTPTFGNTTLNTQLQFADAPDFVIEGSGNKLKAKHGNDRIFECLWDPPIFYFDNVDVYPDDDDALKLGLATNRWSEIHGIDGLFADNVGVGTTTFGTSAAKVVGIANGTAPTTSPADMVQLYAEDVSGSSELKARDEAGNVTVLSDLVIPDTPVQFSFMQSDVAASQSAVALAVLGLAGNTEYVAPFAGSVIGISVASNVARSAGTLTVDITVDGTATGLQAVLDDDPTQYASNTQAKDTDTFTAGQRIGIKITTDGDWAPTTADIVASAFVEW